MFSVPEGYRNQSSYFETPKRLVLVRHQAGYIVPYNSILSTLKFPKLPFSKVMFPKHIEQFQIALPRIRIRSVLKYSEIIGFDFQSLSVCVPVILSYYWNPESSIFILTSLKLILSQKPNFSLYFKSLISNNTMFQTQSGRT